MPSDKIFRCSSTVCERASGWVARARGAANYRIAVAVTLPLPIPTLLLFFLPHIFTVGVKWTVANSFDTTVRPSFRPGNERTQGGNEGGRARAEGAPAADTADKWNGIEAPLAVREGGRNWEEGRGKSRLFPRLGEAAAADQRPFSSPPLSPFLLLLFLLPIQKCSLPVWRNTIAQIRLSPAATAPCALLPPVPPSWISIKCNGNGRRDERQREEAAGTAAGDQIPTLGRNSDFGM